MSAKELQATPCWQGSHRPVATASIGEPRATVQASPCDTSSSGWSRRQRRGHPIAASRGVRIRNPSRRLGRERTRPHGVDRDQEQDRSDARDEVRCRGRVESLFEKLAPEGVCNPGKSRDSQPTPTPEPEAQQWHRECPPEMREKSLIYEEGPVPPVRDVLEEGFHARMVTAAAAFRAHRRRFRPRMVSCRGAPLGYRRGQEVCGCRCDSSSCC